MRPVRDHAEDRMVRVGRGALVVGAGQQAAGEAVGERRLADAARAAQQPGMRQAAALPGAEHGALGCLVAEQVRVGLRCDHDRPSLAATVLRDRLRDGRLVGGRVDDGEAVGLTAGEQAKALPDPLVIVGALGLEARHGAALRRSGPCRPRPGGRGPGSGRGDARPGAAPAGRRPAPGRGRRRSPGRRGSSRRSGRTGPMAAIKCRQDGAVEVILARGEEQIELGQRAPALGRAVRRSARGSPPHPRCRRARG